MRNSELKSNIVKRLGDDLSKPLLASEIATELRLQGRLKKHLQKVLHELVRDGDIVVVRRDRYTLGRPADLLTGDLLVFRNGHGMVEDSQKGRDVFISSDMMGTALPGDRVVVRRSGEQGPRSDREYGRVIRVLDRVQRDIVGTLRTTGRFLCVVPMNPSYSKGFYVPDAQGAEEGDRVVVRFQAWANKHVSPEAEIVEVLGPEDKPDVDTLSVIRHHGLRDTFPSDVVREAETVSARMQTPGRREDLRNTFILTIDPKRARDFDDALSLDRDEDGNRVLGVHIADVSHYVRPGSDLDKEAYERGNSVYLPDKVLPMLPEQLSNGVCSLRPNEDRLAFSVFMTLNRSGTVVARRFAKTRIRSCLRLTYEQAMGMLEQGWKPFLGKVEGGGGKILSIAHGQLVALDKLAQQLRKRRFNHHALALDMPECEVVLNEEGRMTGIRSVVNDRSHQLVEECMVLANEAVATELHTLAVAGIDRLHEPPSEERLEEVAAELAAMGLEPGNLNERRNLARFLREVDGDPLEYHVRVAVLKSMKRAVYSADETGHFGLSKKYYAHFTSPIRRYPDLVVHRQLQAVLTGRKRRYSKHDLQPVAAHCSEAEQVAEKAERAAIELKKFRFLAEQLESQSPQTYHAVVVKVLNFGMFVDLPELQISGMVHVSSISDKFVHYSSHEQTLRAEGRIYKVGERLDVYPVKVDFDSRRIDFALAGVPVAAPATQKHRRSRSKPETANSPKPRRKRRKGRR
ncbi:MAG: ribonuclease R [Kiritimatiellae bacterium]|nr:ribonuclease R [Kiritimatiellia bacterium]